MKHLHKSIFSLALASLLSLASCSQEDVLSGGTDTVKGHPVQLTLTVNRGDAQTRTVLSENDKNGGLNDKWVDGDMLKVYNSAGQKIGELNLIEGADTDTGIFSGEVTAENGTSDYRVWYYNDDVVSFDHNASNATEPTVLVDLSNQAYGDVTALSAMDMLSQDISLTITGNAAVVAERCTMEARLAMVRFSLKNIGAASGTLKIYDELNQNRAMITKGSFGLAPNHQGQKFRSVATPAITVPVTEGKDVYLALYPDSYRIGFEFTETGTNKKYKFAFKGATTLEAGTYYCAFDKDENADPDVEGEIGGIPVIFEPAEEEYAIIFHSEGGDPIGGESFKKETPCTITIDDYDDQARNGLPAHRELLGWAVEGTTDVIETYTYPEGTYTVTLAPVYSGNYIWTIEWRFNYGDYELVPEQGEEKYIGTKDKLTAGYDGIQSGKEYTLPEGYPNDKDNKRRRRTPIGLGKNNPTREGFVFDGWLLERPGNVNGDSEVSANYTWGPNNTILYTGNIAENTKWTIVYKTKWKRVYEIVYHFNSADPKHSNTGGEENAGYNAKVTDRPEGVENGYNYYVISSTSDRFKNQGGVAQTDANGGKIIGWKKCTECKDHYMNDNGTIDSEIKNRVFTDGDTWTFKDGKYILHLEPVYEAAPKTIATPGYSQGTFR